MKSIIKGSQFKEHIKIFSIFQKEKILKNKQSSAKEGTRDAQQRLQLGYSSIYLWRWINRWRRQERRERKEIKNLWWDYLPWATTNQRSILSRKTVQLCKRTLGIRTDQIYKWGYDCKMAMKRYSKLFPESNGIKARFSKSSKDINKNDMNDVVDNIVE